MFRSVLWYRSHSVPFAGVQLPKHGASAAQNNNTLPDKCIELSLNKE
jgi:hypothetical protein